MSRTSASPSRPIAAACSTSWTASSNGHEVARDVGIGDGHRAAVLDLSGECLEHRSARAQHVAEPHALVDAVGGTAADVRQHLSDALRMAETLTGIGRLVGRDVDERSTPNAVAASAR